MSGSVTKTKRSHSSNKSISLSKHFTFIISHIGFKNVLNKFKYVYVYIYILYIYFIYILNIKIYINIYIKNIYKT